MIFAGLPVVESPLADGIYVSVDPDDNGTFVVPVGYTPVLAARIDALRIVQDGLADVRRWLGEIA